MHHSTRSRSSASTHDSPAAIAGGVWRDSAGNYDPLLHMASFSGLTLAYSSQLPGGQWGRTRWRQLESGADLPAVLLARGLDAAETRSTLAHELVHVERGRPEPAHFTLEECLVDLVAATRLISVHDLAALPQRVRDEGTSTVARDLRIDEATLRTALWLREVITSAPNCGTTQTS